VFLRRFTADCYYSVCLERSLGFISFVACKRRTYCVALESRYTLGSFNRNNNLDNNIHLILKSGMIKCAFGNAPRLPIESTEKLFDRLVYHARIVFRFNKDQA